MPYSEIISLNCWGLNSTAFYWSVFLLFSFFMKLWFPSLVMLCHTGSSLHSQFSDCSIFLPCHLPPSRAAAQTSGVPPAISLLTPHLFLLGRPSPWWWPCSQWWALTPCSRPWWVVSTWEQHHLSSSILLIPRCKPCYCTIALISHARKVMLKILQPRLWNSLAFLMIQWMLAIWSLVPLPFLKPAWSLAWSILSITFLACEMSAIVR